MIGLGVFLVLVVLTFVLGVPAATYWTLRRIWGVLLVFGGFALAVELGFAEGFGGPLGLPVVVVSVAVGLAVGLWVYAFLVVTKNAWVNAFREFKAAREREADDPNSET